MQERNGFGTGGADQCARHLGPLVDAVRDGTLPRECWSHEAHLLVAWALLRDHAEPGSAPVAAGPNRSGVAAGTRLDPALAPTVAALRNLIGAYNEACGLSPPRSLCHVTRTRYYVEAVAARSPRTIAELLTDPACSRTAPNRHWSSALLASERAQRSWVEPDLAPLPWRDETEVAT